MTDAPVPTASPPSDLKSLWLPLALIVSIVGVAGSLYLSLGMDLKACPLCFYQRAFIMSVAAILGFGLTLPNFPKVALTPLVLAPATAGTWIAIRHVLLDWTGVLECPIGVTGVLVAPQESLVVYTLLMILLFVDLFHQRRYLSHGLGALMIGIVLGNLCMRSTPPAKEPTAPYDEAKKIDECRKKFHPPT
jgi:hypothetical protein